MFVVRKNYTGGQNVFVRNQKYGIFQCLNGHKISTLSGISLKTCLLAKTNTIFSFLDLYSLRALRSPIISLSQMAYCDYFLYRKIMQNLVMQKEYIQVAD